MLHCSIMAWHSTSTGTLLFKADFSHKLPVANVAAKKMWCSCKRMHVSLCKTAKLNKGSQDEGDPDTTWRLHSYFTTYIKQAHLVKGRHEDVLTWNNKPHCSLQSWMCRTLTGYEDNWVCTCTVESLKFWC